MRAILPVSGRVVSHPGPSRLRGRPRQPAEGCASSVDFGCSPGIASPLNQNAPQSLIGAGSGSPGLNLLGTNVADGVSGGGGPRESTRESGPSPTGRRSGGVRGGTVVR